MYQPKITARDYQEKALERMNGHVAFALLMAMRTGKTKVLLDDFGRLEMEGSCKDLLVIAPAGVYRTWEGEITRHLSEDLLSRVNVFTWESGASRVEKKKIDTFLKMVSPRIFLVNVEALSVATTKAREACNKFLDRGDVMVVIDESTVIKSVKAQRTKFINGQLAPKAKFRRILSGLPTPRSPLDLYGQFQFLDINIIGEPTYASFEAMYAIVVKKIFSDRQRWPSPVVVGYRNTDRLAQLIEPHSFRVEFRPNIPSTYSIRDVAMTPTQRRIYEEMKQVATAMINEEGDHVTATQVIVQILRLHQILCGHTIDEDGKYHDVPSNKINELLELLEDYAGKAVVWVSYDADVKKVAKALIEEYGEKSVSRFWGGNFITREDEETAFKTRNECRFMVSTPSAGGRGRTWSEADLVVYYSSLNNLEHRDQSENRVQGVDKMRQVDYVDLICRGTVEEKILKALRSKIDLASAITGDNWREWVV